MDINAEGDIMTVLAGSQSSNMPGQGRLAGDDQEAQEIFKSSAGTTGYTTSQAVPVFRFFDTGTGSHFYTADSREGISILTPASPGYNPGLVIEASHYGAITPQSVQDDPLAVPVFRFFSTTTGTQFLTASIEEAEALTMPGNAAFRSDLVREQNSTFYEHSAQSVGDVPVYRFFESGTGTHFYTADQVERDAIITPGGIGYRADLVAEGIGFYAPKLLASV